MTKPKFRDVSPSVNYPEMEEGILELWRERDVVARSLSEREGCPEYVFHEGPPTANGRPGIHHVLSRAFKDIFPRYKIMQGYYVQRRGGWDTHGLPVEIEVEKQLGLDGKEQIEAYGIEPFIKECKKSVWKYKTEWEHMSDRVGFWADMEHPYITYEDNYIESIWWALKKIHEKGLLYKGHKIVPYCPRCGTALSSHEVAQGYKDVKETSAVAKFYKKDDPSVALLAWTTTPWTLPSNVALCVNAKETYATAKKDGETFILAAALADSVLTPGYEVLETLKGSDLLGMRYEPLYRFYPVDKEYAYVVAGDFVSTDDGTGIVHIAPAFGADDMEAGRKYDLPIVQTVDAAGRFRPEVTPWAGVFVKDADPAIQEELASRGLYKSGTYEHTYPFCWRCDSPLLYWAKETWYVRTSAKRDRLVDLNQQIWLVSGTHQERAFRQLAGEQRRLGAEPRPLLGHAAAHLAQRCAGQRLRRVHRQRG